MAPKKARDFSFLLKEERPIINEANQQEPEEPSAEAQAQAAETADMAAMMGFAAFGTVTESREVREKRESELLAQRKRADPMAFAAKPTSTGAAGSGQSTSGQRPSRQERGGSEDEGGDDDEDDADHDSEASRQPQTAFEEDQETTLGVPISHEIVLQHGSRPVSALALEPNGARLVSGGYDYQLKFWDFAGMDAALAPFRQILPHEGYPVRALAYSASGDQVLVCTGRPQVKVIDRDGSEILETARGDMYIFDSAKTYGHVGLVNAGLWHPTERDRFVTASSDSTVRIWDISNKKSLLAAKCRSRAGKRTGVNCIVMTRDGRYLVAGCEDGAIHVFVCSKTMIRPKTQVFDAHEGEVTSLCLARDGDTLYSRSTDGTVKRWSLKALRRSEATRGELPCFYNCTDIVLSPDERFVLTGTSGSDTFRGALVILRAKTLEPAYQVSVPSRGVLRILWHLKINQIMVACADGTVKVLFDPVKSDRGAKMCATRAPRKKDPLDMEFGNLNSAALNPYTMDEMREGRWQDKQFAAARKAKQLKDPKAARIPERPVQPTRNVGVGGRTLGYSSSISQLVAKRAAYDPTRDQDPREALLKYAEKAEAEPFFVSKAYEKTQPEAIYNFEEPAPQDDQDPQEKKPKYDPEYKKKQYVGTTSVSTDY